jgi:hypothetical protein
MKTSSIIKVEVDFNHELVYVKGSPSTFMYYSNLTLAFNAIKEALLLNDWEIQNFNYTAIYRAIRQKNGYVKTFKSSGTTFFKIKISRIELNPKLISANLPKKLG